jgi:hypothetical protein
MKSLAMGFIAGADCLQDMETLGKDPAFVEASGGHVNCANAYSYYLKSFEAWQPRKLNELLAETSLKLRRKLFKDNTDFILDIDSTSHQQYGEKMEGVGFNFAGIKCLDSLQAFDQFGFQYWMETREGGTFSSNGGANVVERVFKNVPRNMHRYCRADSAFCNFEMFNMLCDRNVNFVMPMRSNMSDPILSQVKDWKDCKKVIFRDGRNCQIGSTLYYKLPGKQALRVVFIRAKQDKKDMFGCALYDYHAFVTNMGVHQKSDEETIKFYQKRGNAENFIRELKNGFDIHSFPMKRLQANKVYGLIAAMAYNLMRFVSWSLNKNRARFSKFLRFKLVYVACQVVRKARQTVLKFNQDQLKEVQDWSLNIQTKLETS